MLAIPFEASNHASIVAIDPGTETLGVAILKFDLVTFQLVAVEAKTLTGSRLNKYNGWLGEVHGDRASRIFFLQKELEDIFNYVQPLDIVAESPFFSRRRPQAFGALTEIVSAIRYAVMRHDAWKQLILIDPPSVKVAVGAEVQGGKESVRAAILSIAHELNYCGEIPLEWLDEHSIDAIAIALWRFYLIRQMVVGIPLRLPAPPKPKKKKGKK